MPVTQRSPNAQPAAPVQVGKFRGAGPVGPQLNSVPFEATCGLVPHTPLYRKAGEVTQVPVLVHVPAPFAVEHANPAPRMKSAGQVAVAPSQDSGGSQVALPLDPRHWTPAGFARLTQVPEPLHVSGASQSKDD